jgi:nitrite reductase/ring-hydroxylating ferredoxin subunit
VAEFLDVCGVEDVPEGRALAVDVRGLGIAVFRDGGSYHALLGRCPHANGPMGHGWVEDGEAVCPLHHWRFKLSTGRCTTVRGESLHRFPCEVREGRVWVEVP